MSLPTFLGIGMPRSGTRWLARCLIEHPQVHLLPGEVSFFVRRRLLSEWSKGVDWYSQLFENGKKAGAKAWGEVTPVYLTDDEAFRLIHRIVPGAKLICALRDQTEMFHSYYRLFLRFNPALYRSAMSCNTYFRYSPQTFTDGFYLDHIRNYLSLFRREQLLLLLYDDLKSDPRSYIRQVYRFLGVDDSFVPPSVDETINPMELFIRRSEAVHALTQRMQGRRLIVRLGDLLQRVNTTRVPRSGLAERHKFDRALRLQIKDMYAEHNMALGEFLGRDLSHWNRVDAFEGSVAS